MNFPMEYPVFQFFYWLVDTAGVGGVLALLAGSGSILTYGLFLWWIARSDEAEGDTYAYPTPALHHEHDDH